FLTLSRRQVTNRSLAGMVKANQDIDNPGHEFWKRVRFSMRKDDLERGIKEIDEFSRLLERLREKSQHDQQIMVQSGSSSARAMGTMLRKVQVRASKLYRALAQSWTQSCQDPHGARLYLDNRIEAFEASRKLAKSNKIEFNVTLQGCSNASHCTCVVEVLNL